MYKPVTNLINGEIIEALLNLCNDHFVAPYIQLCVDGISTCQFCKVLQNNNGFTNHSEDCPVVKYLKIAEKHKRWIVDERK